MRGGATRRREPGHPRFRHRDPSARRVAGRDGAEAHRHPAEPSAPRSPRRARVLRAAVGSGARSCTSGDRPRRRDRSPTGSRSTSRRRCSRCGSPRCPPAWSSTTLRTSRGCSARRRSSPGRSSTGARPWATGSRTEAGASPYLTDHEPALAVDLSKVAPEWVSGFEVAAGVDVLIHDCQYTEEEYPERAGFGHSSTQHVADFARLASARRLLLFHHDPNHTDDELESALRARARALEGRRGRPRPRRRGDRLRLRRSAGSPQRHGVPVRWFFRWKPHSSTWTRPLSRGPARSRSLAPCTGRGWSPVVSCSAGRTPSSSTCSSGADEGKMERLKEGMLQLTKGWDRAQVERLVEDVILDVIDPYVYAEALDLMELHRSEGRRIYIVSSSPEEVVRPLARHFGVSGVIATRAAIGADGRYTGELEYYAYGEGKAAAVRAVAHRVGDRPVAFLRLQRLGDRPAAPRRRRSPGRREPGQGAAEGGGGTGLADPRLPSARAVADAARFGRPGSEGEHRRPLSRRPASPRCSSGWCCGRAPPAAAPHRRREGRTARCSASSSSLGACDGSRRRPRRSTRPRSTRAPAARPARPSRWTEPRSDGSRWTARACPSDVLVLYRCAPTAVPVLRISSVKGPAVFLGWSVRGPGEHAPGAGPLRRARGDGTEVLIADPLPPSTPTPVRRRPASREPVARRAIPVVEPEPTRLRPRRRARTERWLRLEGRRALHDPPIVWVIGDSILDGGREEVEAALADWSLTLDAESGSIVLVRRRARPSGRRAGCGRRGDRARHERHLRRGVPRPSRRDARHPGGRPARDLADGQGPGGGSEHPRGQRGDPRGRADLPERRDRRLDRRSYPTKRCRQTGSTRTKASRISRPSSSCRCSSEWRDALQRRGATSCGRDGRARDVLTAPETTKRAGGAGIKRLVCIVLGPPDLTWPGDLSMPPAARLARGFCSPRSYLSIALRPYTRSAMLRKRRRSGAGRGGMLQEVGESLGAVGRVRGMPEETARAIRRSSRSTVGAILPGRRWTTTSSRPTACSRRRITTSPGFWRSRYSASETISPMGPS